MKTFAAASLLAALFSPLVSTSSFAASPRRPDVKVCVRIEEKNWSRDGAKDAAPEPAPPPVPAAEPAPPNSTPVPTSEKKLPESPSAANFGAVGPSIPPPAVAIEPGTAPAAPEAAPAATVPSSQVDAFAVDPKRYLKRLIEYQVTHEPGFESVETGCPQTLVVELYPVREGWTVFARFSGTEREEKVDVVQLDEFDTFAERVTTALLRDRSISETLTRKTVLRADSEAEMRRIQTRPHLLFAMGGDTRFGRLPTAPNDVDPAVDRFRVETPLDFALGARNKFRAWALDATARLEIGTQQLAARHNLGGGNVDYSVGFGFGLGFLAYADPDAVNTLYYGGGGSFLVSRYQTLGAQQADQSLPDASGLWGGGLNVDLTLGYEFMRASALHFFVQATGSLPAYVFQSENSQSRVRAWIPSANAQVGILF